MFGRTRFQSRILVGAVVVTALTLPRFAFAQDADPAPWGQMIPTEYERDRLSDDPGAGASVVFDRGTIVVGPGFKFTFERHRRIQIFRQDAYRFANVEIPYHGSEKIDFVEAHTLTKDGRKVKVDLSAFYRQQTGEWQTLRFAFPNVTPGCVVEYRYKIRSGNFYYLRPWVFQNDIPTERSELTVCLPEGFEYAAVVNNKDLVDGPRTFEYSSVLHGNRTVRRFMWASHNLPPLVPEPCIASLLNHRVLLDFQIVRYKEGDHVWEFVDSWSDLAAHVKRIYSPLLRTDESWPRWGTTAKTWTPAEQRRVARQVYEFVRDSVAQVGSAYSVYDPDLKPARTVLALGRGNALEKNLLLVALWRHQGLEAWPILVSRRSHLRFDERDHRLEQFDHAVALVELNGESFFCESNVPGAWLGYLPPDDQVDAGVVIGRDGEAPVVVSLPAPPVGKEMFGNADVTLKPDGSAAGRLEVSVAGQGAYELICALGDHDTTGYLQREWLPGIVPGRIAVVRDTDDDWSPIRMTVEFTWPDAATVDGNRLFVRPSILRKLDDNPLMAAQRRNPISFDTPWSEDCKIVWRLPDGFEFGALPASREADGDGFEFRASVTAEGNTVTASRFWRVNQRDFGVRRFVELRDLFNAVQLSQRGLLVVYRDTL